MYLQLSCAQIMSVMNSAGREHFLAAARAGRLPSACGKTTLAMLRSMLPGFTVRTFGARRHWSSLILTREWGLIASSYSGLQQVY